MDWIRSAMDALDKGYLKDLVFVIYLDPNDQNNVYEMYKFSYGPSGN
jgi:hypothetical protein